MNTKVDMASYDLPTPALFGNFGA